MSGVIDHIFGKVIYSGYIDIDTEAVIAKLGIPRRSTKQRKIKDYPVSPKETLYVLERPEFKLLKEEVLKKIYEYTRDVMKWSCDFEITTSWFNENEPGDSSHSHCHTNALISGVLYLRANPDSGNITFTDWSYKQIKPVPTEYYIHNTQNWTYAPENKMILMFPSDLWHEVEENKSTENRYSLAFNVMPVGTIGNDNTDSHAKIKYGLIPIFGKT
jgi:uncharacterized protein (TIGR02466 family)